MKYVFLMFIWTGMCIVSLAWIAVLILFLPFTMLAYVADFDLHIGDCIRLAHELTREVLA